MKKFLLSLLVIVASISANAQIVTSRTMKKSKGQSATWVIRAGLSLNNPAGGNGFLEPDYEDSDYKESSSLGPRAGMDLSIGFQKPIKTSGLYWGMELGIGTRGAAMKWSDKELNYYGDIHIDEEKSSFLSWNVKYSPFQLGYKYSLNENIKIDGHFGIYASYDFAGKGVSKWYCSDRGKSEESSDLSEIRDDYDFNCFDAGLQLGIGLWWKNLNFDITWQRGFVTAVTLDDAMDDYKDVNVCSSNLMLRLGIAF